MRRLLASLGLGVVAASVSGVPARAETVGDKRNGAAAVGHFRVQWPYPKHLTVMNPQQRFSLRVRPDAEATRRDRAVVSLVGMDQNGRPRKTIWRRAVRSARIAVTLPSHPYFRYQLRVRSAGSSRSWGLQYAKDYTNCADVGAPAMGRLVLAAPAIPAGTDPQVAIDNTGPTCLVAVQYGWSTFDPASGTWADLSYTGSTLSPQTAPAPIGSRRRTPFISLGAPQEPLAAGRYRITVSAQPGYGWPWRTVDGDSRIAWSAELTVNP
jgi:hypothetical protein